jgi:Zn-dependent membrane protease YugP
MLDVNGETVTRLAQVLMLVSMVMIGNPVVGSRLAWTLMLIGSILLYASGLQLRVPLILSAVLFLNREIWMILFLSRDSARRSPWRP